MASNGVEDKIKLAIVTALCKRYSLDPGSISTEVAAGNDIQNLFSNILKLTGNGGQNNEEVMKWVAFADNFPVDSGARVAVLKKLNEELVVKSVLLGNGLTPSEADIIVLPVLHSFVSGLSVTDRQKYPNVLRWIDYVQNKEDFGGVFEKIPLEKPVFAPQELRKVGKGEPDLNAVKTVQSTKAADKVKEESNTKKTDKSEAGTKTKKTGAETSKATEEKKKVPEKESVDKDADVSASLLNIQVGLIRKAWKHPSADSLLVEEIDLGEGNVRQVVSGLAKFCSPDDLTNRLVALITNVKPGKLRDVMSAGLVLCASNQDHSAVEPLLPPAGAKVGERVIIAGHDGKPEDVLNPKKKQLDKITPHLCTDDKGVATFKGIPFMTSAGPCTSSISNGSVK